MINPRKLKPSHQYLWCTAVVLGVSGTCFVSAGLIGYQVVALVLLLTVSVLAMLFEILPVLWSAFLSALIWNYFFIPPLFTFHINKAEDLLMFLMYFVIALLNAVLSFKIRAQEEKARDREEKEQAIKLYNTVLNSLSHELRTPIATLIGGVDTLKDPNTYLSSEQRDALLQQMEKAGSRLNGQVENLLHMNRLEHGMLTLKPDWCDLPEIIFRVIQSLAWAENTHPILFDQDTAMPLFKLDPGIMEQVIYNILQNACQYTPNGTPIKIHLAMVEDQLQLIISDQGPGVPEAAIPLLFDKFYRLPHSPAGGSGLGLSIVKGFVEAHRGSIQARNMKEGGLEFEILIPAETSFVNQLKHE